MSDAREVYELTIAVQPEDIDQMGHVNNVVYLRWVQDAATAHWSAAAAPEDQAALLWVVLRHEIDYVRPALPGDVITARTWVGPASGIKFERHVELRRSGDGVVLARARSLWCPIDSQTMRPVAVRPEVRERFSIPS
jgi:acyl-CoA thioester hydrolase